MTTLVQKPIVSTSPIGIDLNKLPSPCYAVDEVKLQRNQDIIQSIMDRSGANIILALKSFAMWSSFPQLKNTLRGTTASSLNEALLARETFGGEVHVYGVAYSDNEIDELLAIATHITFNTLSQWERFKPGVMSHPRNIKCGLRINPEYSEVEKEIYNPCRPGSRFGITATQLEGADLSGISGLHFHSMCQQNADTLERTLEHVEVNFGEYLAGMEWLNMGGGHHITKENYDTDLLCSLVKRFRSTYGLQVILEPGEAIALDTGYLVSTVLDVFEDKVILNTSATAHMPDVLEMPYRPEIIGAGHPHEKTYTYLLGGLSCLSGDDIGSWSFDHPLSVGDKLIFTDMAQYSMVKNTNFNGINLPSIVLFNSTSGTVKARKDFAYLDYKDRLA